MKATLKLKFLAFICGLTLTAGSTLSYGFEDADIPGDDSVSMAAQAMGDVELTDSDVPLSGEADVMDTYGGPIAFGVIYNNGSKQSGTPNWTSSYNSAYKRYEIKITGENYYYLRYTTVITPAGDVRYCRSSSGSGKLLVYCYDKSGNSSSARFGFATFKAN